MSFNYSKIIRHSRDYFFITFATALYAFGFCGFILPEKVVIGGVSGIGTIVYLLWGIPVAVTQYALNLILLAIAYKVVGKRFVLGTIFGCTSMAFFVGLFQPLLEGGFMNDPVMNVVIGGVMAGFGVGITFTHNGSTGGTDIVAAMVSKYSNVSVGRTMLYVDCFIISSSFFITHKVDTVVYGFVILFVTSYVVDMIINTNRQAVQFTIFSKKWQEIATAINNDAKRGCTVLTGMGWYSKKEVKMLIVMCRKIESVNISRIIKSIDPDAFTTQANVNGVYGQGFDELKVKMKLPHHGEEKEAHEHTQADHELKEKAI